MGNAVIAIVVVLLFVPIVALLLVLFRYIKDDLSLLLSGPRSRSRTFTSSSSSSSSSASTTTTVILPNPPRNGVYVTPGVVPPVHVREPMTARASTVVE